MFEDGKAHMRRDQAHRRTLHRQRLNAASILERELYRSIHLHDPTTGPHG